MFRSIQEIQHSLVLPTNTRVYMYHNSIMKRQIVLTMYIPFYFNSYSTSVFPKMIVNLLKNESQLLSAAFTNNIYDNSTNEFDLFRDLNPIIKLELKKCVDVHNKFLKILHSDPSDIPINIYIHFLQNDEIIIDDSVRGLVVQRLTYHGLYDLIWKYLIHETTSINDAEEIVENMGYVLKERNNLIVGTLESMLSLYSNVAKQSLRNIIIDSASYRFEFSKQHLLKALESNYASSLNNYWQWLMNSKNVLSNDSHNTLPEVHFDKKLPGWFSFVTKGLPKLSRLETINILEQGYHIGLNDGDLVNLISWNLFLVEELFLIFKRGYLHTPFLSTSLNALMKQAVIEHKSSVICEMIDLFSTRIIPETVSLAIQYLYTTHCPSFGPLIDKLLTENAKSTGIFELFFRSDISWDHDLLMIHKALLSIHESSDFLQIMRRHFPIPNNGRKDILSLYKKFVEQGKLPTKVLLEIARSIMLRNQFFNDDVICIIFVASINKLVPSNKGKNQILKNKKSLKKFHNTIRAIGQIISLLKPDDISVFINQFLVHVLKDGTMANFNTEFKFYIFQNLLEETLRFLRKRIQPQEIKEILRSLKIKSKLKQSLLFFYEVYENPQRSFSILKEFQKDKSKLSKQVMAYIEEGILTSPLLVAQQRVVLFYEFRSKLINLGYKSKLRQRTIILLTDVVIGSSKKQDYSRLRDSIRTLCTTHKIPHHIVNRWTTKLKECE